MGSNHGSVISEGFRTFVSPKCSPRDFHSARGPKEIAYLYVQGGFFFAHTLLLTCICVEVGRYQSLDSKIDDCLITKDPTCMLLGSWLWKGIVVVHDSQK